MEILPEDMTDASLRKSEIYALIYDDIDQKNSKVRISKATVMDENNEWVIKGKNRL